MNTVPAKARSMRKADSARHSVTDSRLLAGRLADRMLRKHFPDSRGVSIWAVRVDKDEVIESLAAIFRRTKSKRTVKKVVSSADRIAKKVGAEPMKRVLADLAKLTEYADMADTIEITAEGAEGMAAMGAKELGEYTANLLKEMEKEKWREVEPLFEKARFQLAA